MELKVCRFAALSSQARPRRNAQLVGAAMSLAALLSPGCSHETTGAPGAAGSAENKPAAALASASGAASGPTVPAASPATPPAPACKSVASGIPATAVWRRDPKKGLVLEVKLSAPTVPDVTYPNTPPKAKNAELVSSQTKNGQVQIRAKPNAKVDYFEVQVAIQCPAGTRDVRLLVNLPPSYKAGAQQKVDVAD